MNPFSAFLQPQQPRPLLGGDPGGDIARVFAGRREEKQRALENTQRNDLAQKENTRANSYLQLQQAQQQRKFTDEDQKQVEGLLAEYHDALDTGDSERVNRATAMLKRFGMDVKAGTDPKSVPDLKAFTGQQALPTVAQKPDLQALTGQAPNPIDEAVQTEMQSRDALRAKNAAPEQDLSQSDFEEQLVNGDQAPSRYEEGGKTTSEFKKMLPSSDEPDDLGDVDDPAFQAAAQAEAPGGVVDLDADGSQPLQIGGSQAATPPRLATQRLPTVISKGGQVLEQSNGIAGRYAPMVSAVFEPYANHQVPEMAEAGKRAQQLAMRLVAADGFTPEKAIKMAGEQMKSEMSGITNLERTKIGSKAHVVGSAMGANKPFSMKDRSPYANLIHQTITEFKNENIEAGVRGYDAGLSAINSSNPASQYDAINQLLTARSGKTVSDRERAIYDNLAGVWAGLTKKIDMASGQPMPSEYRNQIRQLLAEAKAAVVQAREERAKAAEDTHRAKLRGADPATVDSDSKAVGNAIRMGTNVDENADLDR